MALRSCCGAIATGILTLTLVSASAFGQQSKTVSGIVVNFGIMSAEAAVRAEGHREAHPSHFPPGSQHLLITLDDARTGKRIGGAEVTIEVTDPKGRVEKKPLLHTHAGGLPDYSELFEFGWSGEYKIRVTITLLPGTPPIQTQFTVDHRI
jgi:hypothetical protein